MFSKDMTDDKMTFEARNMSRATRVITCKVRPETSVLMRACGEVLSAHPPSRSWQWLLSGRETAIKNLRNAEDYEWNPDSMSSGSGQGALTTGWAYNNYGLQIVLSLL